MGLIIIIVILTCIVTLAWCSKKDSYKYLLIWGIAAVLLVVGMVLSDSIYVEKLTKDAELIYVNKDIRIYAESDDEFFILKENVWDVFKPYSKIHINTNDELKDDLKEYKDLINKVKEFKKDIEKLNEQYLK